MSIYLLGGDAVHEPAGRRFAALVRRGGILQIPGVYNALSPLQAKRHRFEALYLSGAAISASMGLPDLGIITIEDVCLFIRQVSHASALPVLVDGDTGYGEALGVRSVGRVDRQDGAAWILSESDSCVRAVQRTKGVTASGVFPCGHAHASACTCPSAVSGLDGFFNEIPCMVALLRTADGVLRSRVAMTSTGMPCAASSRKRCTSCDDQVRRADKDQPCVAAPG